jgi:hypothetical protein
LIYSNQSSSFLRTALSLAWSLLLKQPQSHTLSPYYTRPSLSLPCIQTQLDTSLVSSPLPLPIDSPSAFRPDPGLVLGDPLTVPCFIFLADSREQLSSSSSPILSRPASQSGAARKDFSIGQLFLPINVWLNFFFLSFAFGRRQERGVMARSSFKLEHPLGSSTAPMPLLIWRLCCRDGPICDGCWEFPPLTLALIWE